MRLEVRKTYKLAIGGASVRSESGRVVPVTGAGGDHLANAPLASRKDARDAVRAARAALGPWRSRTAYNRGQILYRLAEVLEARTDELAGVVAASTGVSAKVARAELAACVEAAVHYAGWPDKLASVLGGVNQVAQPYFAFSVPEPVGVVALVGARRSPRFRAWSSRSARRWRAATPSSRWCRSGSRSPASTWQRCSPPATCRAAS